MGMNLRDKIAFDVLLHTVKAADAELLASRYGKDSSGLGLPEGTGEQEIHKAPDGLSVRATLDAAQMPEALRRQLSAQFQPVVSMIRPNTEKPAAKGVVIQASTTVLAWSDSTGLRRQLLLGLPDTEQQPAEFIGVAASAA